MSKGGTNRREFLKYALTGAVGLGIGGALGYSAAPPAAPQTVTVTPTVQKQIIALSKVPSAVEASIDWGQFSGESITVIDLPYERFKGFDEQLIPEFQKLTGITVNLITLGDSDLLTKTLTEAQGKGTSIDAYFIDGSGPQAQFGQLDALQPFEPLIEDASITDKKWLDLEDYFPGTISLAKLKGSQIALPSSPETTAIGFRKSVVEKYMGADFVKKLRGGPTSGVTFDELKEAVKAVHMYDGKTAGFNTRHTGNIFGSIDYDPWATVNWGFGAKGVLDPVTKHPWLNTPEQAAGLQWMQDVMWKYTMPGSQNWFVDEGYASVYDSTTVFSYYCTSLLGVACFDPVKTKDYGDWGIGTIPIGPAGVQARRAYVWCSLDVINKYVSDRKKKAAWLWLQYKHSKDAEKLAAFQFLQSPRKSSYDDPNVQRALGASDAFGAVYLETMNNFANSNYYGISDEKGDYLPEVSAIIAILGPDLNAAAFGLETPSAALSDANGKIDKLMHDKGYY